MLAFVLALVLLAQDAPLTNLTITGAEPAVFTHTDTNACDIDDSDNTLTAQLTDPVSPLIISLEVLGTVGNHPALNQLTALSVDGPDNDPFVNWSSTGGTVTLDDIAATVPVEGGDPTVPAFTHGVTGRIEADLTSRQGAIHISGSFACHNPA